MSLDDLDRMPRVLSDYASESPKAVETEIEARKNVEIGTDRKSVIERVREKSKGALKLKTLEAGYDAAELHADAHRCSPRSAWGMFCGLTRASQRLSGASARMEADKAATMILNAKW
jgi:hypothetical protein